ncbi:polysaccharide biosynthesis/export family protein [Vibrio scophthalmi]|uniref:Putative polysaccharide export-related protein n=1 Tax=Vibrio scophthalmi LMG 19158 TaxID=870967 RepID=F9RSC0_9VIBR|nr:polysaccharide biosynthesis/export family protein [Vibrio scophthalmi]EGU32446.1 putative polysaccharide export-related protein [Vibrio scophthalmi LMG 19158]MCY9804597.1 polysaccharide export protein [Vibrio scophthalmi]
MINKLFKILVLSCISIGSVNANTTDLYQLAAGDVISIKVYGEENLTIDEQKIDNREVIDYPYLGVIKLGGKTLEQVQSEITQGLQGDYLVNPKVNVAIVQYRNVYINGLVNKPGGYEYEPGLTVQKAISLAGGVMSKYRRSARAYRTKSTESDQYAHLSAEQLAIEFDKNTETEAELYQVIYPGDTIHVVASFW